MEIDVEKYQKDLSTFVQYESIIIIQTIRMAR